MSEQATEYDKREFLLWLFDGEGVGAPLDEKLLMAHLYGCDELVAGLAPRRTLTVEETRALYPPETLP